MPGLKKRWGQHHLTDGRICRPLAEFLAPDGDTVVEIGPGGGVLTAELLAAGAARVVAWEIDPEWAVETRRRVDEARLSVVVGDALQLSWPHLARRGPVLAAGNLPYNVATPIIERLLPHHRSVPRAGFLVQREVAERLVAGPADGAYGYLSVLVAAHADARLLAVVRRGSFHPPPKVEGAFVGLALRPPPLPRAEMEGFLGTVSLAFARRRKTVRNSLASGLGRDLADRALERTGLDPRRRAERLSLDDFLALHRARREVEEGGAP